MNIQTKLQLAFVLLGLLSVGATGWQAFDTSRDALETATFERLTSVRETMKSRVEEWFASHRLLLREAADDEVLRAEARRAVQAGSAARDFFRSGLRYTQEHAFSALFLTDTGGTRLYCECWSAGAAAAAREGARPGAAALHHAARRAAADTGCIVTDFDFSSRDAAPPMALFAVKLADAGRAPLVLVAAISIDRLNTLATSGGRWLERGLGESGETYIVGSDLRMRSDSRFFLQDATKYLRGMRARGADSATLRLIAARRSTALVQTVNTAAARAALRGESGTLIDNDYRGVRVISAFAPLDIEGVRWVLLAEIDTREAFSAIAALRERLALSGLITLLAGLVVGVVVARGISRPVLQLARHAERFGRGAHTERAHVGARGEIGTLASTFNAMADRITRNTEALEREIHERRDAEQRLTASRESLRNLSAHLHSVREDERKGMAREIHDELGQALTTLKLELRILDEDVRDAFPDLHRRIDVMSGLIDTTLRSVKQLITDLRPRLLDDLGLTAAIEWQAEDFSRRTGIACAVEIAPDDIALDPERSIAIFRIFQEALTNTARHSGADAVTARLASDASGVILDVRDNGRGITGDEASHPGSFGLLGMRERAAYWGGTAEIDGAPGRGTRVRVFIPHHREDT